MGAALAHYATGVQVAERALPERFGGVLGWGWLDNRPFLRCLHGLTISAWRLGEHDAAGTFCWALCRSTPPTIRASATCCPRSSRPSPGTADGFAMAVVGHPGA